MPDRPPYETQLEQFRIRAGIGIGEWCEAAGMTRAQFLRYRSGIAMPHSRVLANLVRSATRLTGKRVRASDLYDLGDGEPLGTPVYKPLSKARKAYRTRLDEVMRARGIVTTEFAAMAGKPRQSIRNLRAGRVTPGVPMMAAVVRGLRRMGVDVKAQDLFDVGDD